MEIINNSNRDFILFPYVTISLLLIQIHQLQFFDDVDEFLEYQPDGLIGVHGTDSVNRPGYLIARYLIEKFSWDPNVAINVSVHYPNV